MFDQKSLGVCFKKYEKSVRCLKSNSHNSLDLQRRMSQELREGKRILLYRRLKKLLSNLILRSEFFLINNGTVRNNN